MLLPGIAVAKQVSSPAPGPTGRPLNGPRRTSEDVAPEATFQLMLAWLPDLPTATPLSTSGGAGAGIPVQVPL